MKTTTSQETPAAKVVALPRLVRQRAALAAWRKATRKLWIEFHKANDVMLRIAREKPQRPWHKKRHAQAMKEYERTLNAIPMPPCDENGDLLPNDKLRHSPSNNQ